MKEIQISFTEAEIKLLRLVWQGKPEMVPEKKKPVEDGLRKNL